MRAMTPVARIDAPSPEVFEAEYVRRSRPVILRGAIDDWPATERWSLDRLAREHGDLRVLAARLDRGAVVMDARRGLEHAPVTLGAFLEALRGGARDRYVSTPLAELPPTLARDAPLPPYCDGASWHDGNLWIGADGTTSGLHFDVADNFHAVVSGRKRFVLAPPRQSASLYPNGPLHGVPNGARVDLERPDFERFPRMRDASPVVAELGPGDLLYIPSMWWHQAHSDDVSISINLWWAKGPFVAILRAAEAFMRLRDLKL